MKGPGICRGFVFCRLALAQGKPAVVWLAWRAMNTPLIHTLSDHLKARFGTKVRKLSLHGRFTCPNRDGTLGRGGCTFCNVASFVDEGAADGSVADQLCARKAEMRRPAGRYLAYFQAYTSTYGEYEVLERLYREALAGDDVVGLCVGTRPDCVSDAVLALLGRLRAEGQEIWLELGLQSAHDDTLKRINRGHGFGAYADAVARAQLYGVPVCTHLILGLPGEDEEMTLTSLQRVAALGVQGLKLHPLHVVEGSILARSWRAGRYQPWTLERYVTAATELIRHTPSSVVYHRIAASARPPTLLAPEWCADRWAAPQAIEAQLKRLGGQGSAC